VAMHAYYRYTTAR